MPGPMRRAASRPISWFFTHAEQVAIEQDKDHAFTAAMKQQVRELTLVVEPTGDAAGRITEIAASLTGAAGTLDFATDTYGAASNVVLPFTKITEGDDAGKWKATVRLLGVTGTEQLLTGEIRYADATRVPRRWRATSRKLSRSSTRRRPSL